MRYEGFGPVYDGESRLLILGSFPSVMSRAEGFYYGNPRNRFWPMLSSFFGRSLPASVAEKRALLSACRVALWDMVSSCEIRGSDDAAIRGEEVVDVRLILRHAHIERVLCNGTKSFELLEKFCPSVMEIARKMPSTSPANPRFDEKVWHAALGEVFYDV